MSFGKRVEAIKAKFEEAIDELLDLMVEESEVQPILAALNPIRHQPGVTHRNVWHTEAVLADGYKIEDTIEMDHVYAVESSRAEEVAGHLVSRGKVLMILSLEKEEE